MILHRLRRQVQEGRYLLAAPAFRDQLHHLTLAPREILIQPAPLREPANHSAGGAAVVAAPADYCLDRPPQAGQSLPLLHIAVRHPQQCLFHQRRVGGAGVDQDARLRDFVSDPAQNLRSTEARQQQVEDQEVWTIFGAEIDRLQPVACRSHDFVSRVAHQDADQHVPDRSMIIHHHNPFFHPHFPSVPQTPNSIQSSPTLAKRPAPRNRDSPRSLLRHQRHPAQLSDHAAQQLQTAPAFIRRIVPAKGEPQTRPRALSGEAHRLEDMRGMD